MGKSKDLATGASYQDQTESDARYANVSGDTFTGTVTVTGSTNTNTTLNVVTPNWVSGAYADFNLGYQPISRKIRGSWIDGIEVYTNNANAALRVDASGRVTMPYQPLVSLGSAGGSISQTTTGQAIWGGSGYVFQNVGNHWNDTTKVFTAPVTGTYYVSVGIRLSSQNYTSNTQYNYIYLYNSNNSSTGQPIYLWSPSNEPNGYRPHNISCALLLNANDTFSPKFFPDAGNVFVDAGTSSQTDTFLHLYLMG